MPTFIRALLLTLLLCFDVAFSFHLHSRHTYLLKGTHEVAIAWSRGGSAHPEFLLTLQIEPRQSQFDKLERHLYEVSTPSREEYGKHPTPVEVNWLIKPSEDVLDGVYDCFETYGVERAQLSHFSAKDWIKTQLPVSGIERLFYTQYFIYELADGTQLVRVMAWSLSSHLHQHIETVQPTNSFFRPKHHRGPLDLVQFDIEIGAESLPCQKEVLKIFTFAQACNATPLCLRTIYGTIDHVPKVPPGKNSVALNNYDGQMSNRSDVAVFLSQHRACAVPAAHTLTIDVLSGGADQQSPINTIPAEAESNTEGNLDAEILLSFGYLTSLIACNTGGEPPYQENASEGPNGVNEPYLDWLHYVPPVISSSYGDGGQTFPYFYAKVVCNQFAQLGARGVTFPCACGDNGVGPRQPSCPVSSTPAPISPMLNSDMVIFMGAYPDIAAQGQQVATTCTGRGNPVDGTGGSTLNAAGVLTLVDDALIATGKSPFVLGF